jgi:hypothetical protein
VLALLIIVYSIPVFLLRKSHAAVIFVATAATLATGFVCFNVVVAAGWSVLHGGLSEGAFYVLYAVVAVAPPALGFLAGVATRHRLSRRVPPDQMGRSYSTCPDCGSSLKRLADDSATPTYAVVECPIHGPYYFSASTPLTLGRPPHGQHTRD